MDEAHSKWLAVNRSTLLNRLDAREVADHLISREVLSPKDEVYENLDADRTEIGRARLLLDFLSRKGPSVFAVFQEILCELDEELFKQCNDALSIRSSHHLSLSDIVREVDSVVKTFYRNQKQVPVFTWMTRPKQCSISDLFLNLVIIRHKEAVKMIGDRRSERLGCSEEDGRRDYVYSRARKQDATFYNLEDLFRRPESTDRVSQGHVEPVASTHGHASSSPVEQCSSDEDFSQQIGLYGGAGCGKTASCLKALKERSEGRLWNGFQLVLLWHLRKPDVQRASTLKDLLRALPVPLSERQSTRLSEHLEESDGRGVLLVLDGIDELRRPSNNAYVVRLLERTRLHRSSILVTSRPCYEAEQYFKTYDVCYEIIGFTDDQVLSYIHYYLEEEGLALRMHDFLNATPHLAGLMYVPLFAAMLCEIFKRNAKDPPKTRTAMFSKITLHIFQRAVAQGRIRSIDLHKVDKYKDLEDFKGAKSSAWKLLKKFGRLAYLAHKRKKVVFDSALLDEVGCDFKALQLGLLLSISSDDEVELCVIRECAFSHLTFQEFFAAWHIVRKVKRSKERLEGFWKDKGLQESTHSFVVWQFVAGLLSGDQHRDLQEHLFSLLNVWLYESPNVDTVQKWSQEWHEKSEVCRRHLQQCINCVQEAGPGHMDNWQSALHLPKTVHVSNATPSRLLMLAKAMRFCRNDDFRRIELQYEKVETESQEMRASRIQSQLATATMQLMASLVMVGTLREISIDGPQCNFMEDPCWSSMLTIARGNKLEYIRLWRCTIGDARACQLLEVLNFISLTSLSLSYNHVGDTAVGVLAGRLRHNMKLEYLYLGCNNIGDAGVQQLANSLQDNGTLLKLYLNNNRIGDRGATALALALKDNHTLKILYLYRNSICNEGACELACALQDSCAMEYLRLTENPIGEEGARALEDLGRRFMVHW